VIVRVDAARAHEAERLDRPARKAASPWPKIHPKRQRGFQIAELEGLGVNVAADQTLRVRVYPYNTTTTTGKSIMLANLVVSGVTN
jgi:hypothetical protein